SSGNEHTPAAWVIGATIRCTGGPSIGIVAQKIEFIVSITRLVICTPLGRPVVPPELIRMATSSGASGRSGAVSPCLSSQAPNAGASRHRKVLILGQAALMRGRYVAKLE